jgi:uncharacterized protein
MIFTLTELEHHPIQFDVTYQPGEIALSGDLRQKGNLHAAGSATLLRNTLGEIRLRGHVTVDIEGECDRCLDSAHIAIDNDFDLFYRPVLRTANHAEMRLEDGETEISFYEGGVSLEDALREFVLLSCPMQLFCRPDCRGICPSCGVNRNEHDCACAASHAHDRWAGLRKL